MKKILSIVILLLILFSVLPVDASVYGITEGIGAKGERIQGVILPISTNIGKPPIIHGRIIAPAKTEREKSLFTNKGCQIVHDLQEGTAFDCPILVAKGFIQQRLAVEDELYQLHDLESDEYIEADHVWAQGITGTGVKVAILDTGVDPTHPEIEEDILAMKSFALFSRTDPIDRDGHGTHVIGIVTGEGLYSIDASQIDGHYASPNRAKGVADGESSFDGAWILSGKVCGPLGCYLSDVSKGIEWAVSQGADVISMSLGGGNYFGENCDGMNELANKANWAVDQGVVVVASAGNANSGVSAPACGSKVIAVGAVYQRNIGPRVYEGTCTDLSTAPDQRTCFSNRGPALDLMAPGAGILSTYSCYAGGDCNYVWHAWYFGTSQAAPHVAGAAALLLEKDPSLTPAEVKQILESTARDLGAFGRDDQYGWGVIDANAAVASLNGCTSDAECDDQNECTVDLCTGGSCSHTPASEETACSGGGICCSGQCRTAECSEDSDCSDGDACTINTCLAASPCSATCSMTLITTCVHDDGCCPAGCDSSSDSDCPSGPSCGDGVCEGEFIESCWTCLSDCQGIGKLFSKACCGDMICTKFELLKGICPMDCP